MSASPKAGATRIPAKRLISQLKQLQLEMDRSPELSARVGRLIEVLATMDPESTEFSLGATLDAAFAGESDPMRAFRDLRERVQKLDQPGALGHLMLAADRNGRRPATDRTWWALQTATMSSEALAAIMFTRRHLPAGDDVVAARGIPSPDGKRLVNIGFEMAPKDQESAMALIDLVLRNIRNRQKWRPEVVGTTAILVNTDDTTGSNEATRRANTPPEVLVAFVSPELLDIASDDPPSGTRLVPALLKRISPKANLRHYAGLQLIGASGGRAEGPFFSLRSPDKREAFADHLVDAIESVVECAPILVETAFVDEPDLYAELGDLADLAAPTQRVLLGSQMSSVSYYEPSLAAKIHATQSTDNEHIVQGAAAREADSAGVDVQEYLLKWLADDVAPEYFALLGEYGMGKTTACQELARTLTEPKLLPEDHAGRPVIYFDLRNLGGLIGPDATLTTIITTLIDHAWMTGAISDRPTAHEVIELVGSERALVMFDGLDEVLVHRTAAEGQRFVRQLWSILPPIQGPQPGGPESLTAGRGRVLLTCRTHYFRKLAEQQSFFGGEQREPLLVATAADYKGHVHRTQYDALVLMPFNDAQIRRYLEHYHPEQISVRRALALLGSIHNLNELARRPYLLAMITSRLTSLEERTSRGGTINAAELYGDLVEGWLRRDDGKHRFGDAEKTRLMEELASWLWKRNQRSLTANDLDRWLQKRLSKDRALKRWFKLARHRVTLDELSEDLRTAAFVVRPDVERFEFAHTSMLEYFVARWIHYKLITQDLNALSSIYPSAETQEFLGGLIANISTPECLECLQQILSSYRRGLTEWVIEYSAMAHLKGFPHPSLEGADLRHAELSRIRLVGTTQHPLRLANVQASGADFSNSYWQHVDLDNADLTAARLDCARMYDVSLRSVRFDAAHLTGAIFRDSLLVATPLSEAIGHRTQLLRCRSENSRPLDQELADDSFLMAPMKALLSSNEPHDHRIVAYTGHPEAVKSVAFCHRDRLLASTGLDDDVRLWDVKTRECVNLLIGHVGPVNACASRPGTAELATGGTDRSVRFWNVDLATCIATVDNFPKPVTALAYTPDGQKLAIACEGTISVRDVLSDNVVHTIKRPIGHISQLAFSPDGALMASCGADRTVRIWSTSSWQLVTYLAGHSASADSIAFDPSGDTVASGSKDGTIRIWDPITGVCLKVLSAHSAQVRSIAFSPDGRVLASASADATLRLWDPKRGRCKRIVKAVTGSLSCLTFDSFGSQIAAASEWAKASTWDPGTGDQLGSFSGQEDTLNIVRFSNSSHHFSTGGKTGTLRIWDGETGNCLRAAKGIGVPIQNLLVGTGPGFQAVVFADREVALFNNESVEKFSLPPAVVQANAIALSHDSRLVAFGTEGGESRVLDLNSPSTVTRLSGHILGVNAVEFSPDDRLVGTASDDASVRLWNLSTQPNSLILHGHSQSVNDISFSSVSPEIASGSDDGTVRIWNTAGGECVRELTGHNGAVLFVAFRPNGNELVSAGADRTLRIWDIDHGECIRVIAGLHSEPSSLTYDSSGERIAATTEDCTARVWDASTGFLKFVVYQLSANEVATIDGKGKLLSCTPGAWRYLGYQARLEDGTVTRIPAESYGPLPTYDLPEPPWQVRAGQGIC